MDSGLLGEMSAVIRRGLGDATGPGGMSVCDSSIRYCDSKSLSSARESSGTSAGRKTATFRLTLP